MVTRAEANEMTMTAAEGDSFRMEMTKVIWAEVAIPVVVTPTRSSWPWPATGPSK